MARPVVISLGIVVLSVVLQTTVFAPGRFQPFGAAPNLVLLTVIAIARYLEAEAALLVGFTGGLLVDLLSASPLGVWAMVLTATAFASHQLLAGKELGWVTLASAVFGMALAGQLLFVFIGTLFGQQTISDPDVLRKIILPAVYSVILGPAVFWAVRAALRPEQRTWAV